MGKYPEAKIGWLLLVLLTSMKFANGNTPVRLVNGIQTDTTLTGRLEVFFADIWGTVCKYGFGASTAKTVCGFLGYSRGYRVLKGGYGKGTGPIWLKDLRCLGSETDIDKCSHKPWGDIDYCIHYTDVALVCTNLTLASETYGLRLVGGEKTPLALTGRLEVFFSGTWGTVCSNSLPAATAKKLCGFLGYNRGYSVTQSKQRKENGPVWLGNVVCSGTESNISQCSADPWGSPACVYEVDTLLMCSNVPEGSEKYDIRLTGGETTSTSRSGRLEVFYNGVWGSVVDDSTPSKKTAETLCGFLGYSRAYAILDSVYQDKSGPGWLSNVQCSGNETDISGCAHDGWGKRPFFFMNVILVCSNVSEASETYQMRLVGGENIGTSSSGRLQVLYSGIWGTVCISGVSDLTVTTLCRFLGYSRGYTPGYMRQDNAPIWLGDLSCSQNDANISQCSHQPWGMYRNYQCDPIFDLLLFCSQAQIDTYEIRLVNGEKTTTTLTGRLEVFFSGIWGTVCDYGFTTTSAVTLCRSLGYSRGYVLNTAPFGEGTGPIWSSNVDCLGYETNISQCARDSWGKSPCHHSSDVGLVCTSESTETYSLRLVGGEKTASGLNGRLQVLYSGVWGSVCDEGHSIESTNTLCRFLGYRATIHKWLPVELAGVWLDEITRRNPEDNVVRHGHPLMRAYEQTVGWIWISGVRCVGNEANISQCQHSGWGTHHCHSGKDIGLACFNGTGT